MQENAKIVEIGQKSVSVIPVDIEACIGCSNSECRDNGHVFEVVNRRRMDIKVGDVVRVQSTMKNQLAQGVTAVGVPVTCAIAAFVIASILAPGSGEGFRVGLALAALLAGGVATYFVTKRTEDSLPEIVQVL